MSHTGYSGPWHLLARNSILKNPNGSAHRCEESEPPPCPCCFLSCLSSLFCFQSLYLEVHPGLALVNTQSARSISPTYAHSLDAIDWTLSPTSPYDCVLEYVDGTHAEASGCGNRPQIMFGEDGETAQFIINGAYAANPTGSKNSWTLFRPITQPGQHL